MSFIDLCIGFINISLSNYFTYIVLLCIEYCVLFQSRNMLSGQYVRKAWQDDGKVLWRDCGHIGAVFEKRRVSDQAGNYEHTRKGIEYVIIAFYWSYQLKAVLTKPKTD